MTPFPRAFMRYCKHLIRGVFIFLPLLGYSVFSNCKLSYTNLFLSFSTLSFYKQHHHPKYSLLLLNPISKQYYAALVVHNSIFLDHVNTTLFLVI